MKNYNKYYDEPEFTTTAEFEDTYQETVIEPQPDPATKEELGIVNAREVYLRQGPGTEYEHVGTAKKGDCLIIFERVNDFLKVENQDGVQAYIMERFVDTN